jgi:3-hydroxybutyryl-CoA dehydrogenase
MTDTTALPGRVLVYGGGRMGAGIAHAFVAAGSSVQVIESDTASARAAVERVTGSLRKAAEKGTLTEDLDAVLRRLAVSTGPHPDHGDVELAIEAVPEDLELKRSVFRRLEQAVPHAVLATNTSSLSIDSIADGLESPERFIGLHFFNPVPVMQLLELIRGMQTSDETLATAQEFAKLVGKTPIVAKNSPGFVVNRILCPMINEAIFALQEGLASAEDIDTGMRLGCNQPIGPLALADLIGLDTMLSVMNVFYEGFNDPKYRPAPLLKEMVAAGRLGRKTGRGFYNYA